MGSEDAETNRNIVTRNVTNSRLKELLMRESRDCNIGLSAQELRGRDDATLETNGACSTESPIGFTLLNMVNAHLHIAIHSLSR